MSSNNADIETYWDQSATWSNGDILSEAFWVAKRTEVSKKIALLSRDLKALKALRNQSKHQHNMKKSRKEVETYWALTRKMAEIVKEVEELGRVQT